MARAGWANCRTLQSGLQVPHGTQSLLGDFGIGVSAHFFQVGDAIFVSTHREHARQADLLVFRRRLERLIERLTGAAIARHFRQEGQCLPFVGAGIQIIDEETQRAEFAGFGPPQHHQGERQGNPRRRLAFVLPGLFDEPHVRRIAQAREAFGRGAAHLLLLIVLVLLVDFAAPRGGPAGAALCVCSSLAFRSCCWIARLRGSGSMASEPRAARRTLTSLALRRTSIRSGTAARLRNRPVVSMAAIRTLEFRSRSRNAICGPTDSSRIFCMAISDSYSTSVSLVRSAWTRSGTAALPRRIPTARAALARAGMLAAPETSAPSAAMTSGRAVM